MKPKVRVLIVTNDWQGVVSGGFLRWADQTGPDITADMKSREFHLGEFVRVLRETSWHGFDLELTKAHRDSPAGGETEAQMKSRTGADVLGFRFDSAHQAPAGRRSLADYDVALFFPIDPSPHAYETPTALAAEAAAISRFMEAGGGFFATGDHEDLGAPLCRLIPRVRSMRRWHYAGGGFGPSAPGPAGEPPAPSGAGSDRHDTTRPWADGTLMFENQSDAVAQPIEPRLYPAGIHSKVGFIARRYLPHPLLCSPDGVVTWLPDHMHEGWCEVPSDLSRTFTLDGASVAEYPPAVGGSGPLAPEVVATGRSLSHALPAIDPVHFSAATPAADRTFGVIGAWDGHLANKGRVVVDSTWHHEFDINLTGDRYLEDAVPAEDPRRHGFYVRDPVTGLRRPSDEYRMICWYFRNIIYWLIPAKRRAPIVWELMTDIGRLPRLVEELATVEPPGPPKPDGGIEVGVISKIDFGAYLYFGQLAEAYLRKARGACGVLDVEVELFMPKIPWWEWIQEIVEVWRPERQFRPQLSDLRLLGAMGLGPQPEALLQAGLGAAVVAAARLRRNRSANGELPLERYEHAWLSEFENLGREVASGLQRTAELLPNLQRLTAMQDRRTSSGIDEGPAVA